MALRDEVRSSVPPMLPRGGPEPVSGQDPQSMEEIFRPEPDKLPAPKPMKVRTAANDVGFPERRSDAVPTMGQQATPDIPEKAPGQQLTGLVKPDDSRYKDPQNLLMGNVLLGGSLPYIQAAADVAAGRVPSEQFDAARQEHERRINELKDQHPDFVSAAEKAMPFVEGALASIIKPAGTVAGTMARGAAVAAPQGAVRGYTSGPTEEPSISGERLGRAVGSGATDAALGAAGASLPALTEGAKKIVGKATSIVAARSAEREAAALTRRTEAEAAAKAQATKDKRAASTAKGQATKLAKAQQAERATAATARLEIENKQIATDYARHIASPKTINPHAQENRSYLMSDPIHVFNQTAEEGWGLEGLSKSTGLSPRAIVNRMSDVTKDLPTETPQQKNLFAEMMDVDRTSREFKKRGLDAATGSAQQSVAQPAGGTPAGQSGASNPAGNGSTAAKPKPSARKPAAKPAKPRASRAKPKPTAD